MLSIDTLEAPDRKRLAELLTPRMNGYMPHVPTAHQQAAMLCSDHREILYGGAAGGGKTDWLLMEALQFVDVPGYAALLLRRTHPQLSKSDGLIERSREWLADTPATYSEKYSTWTFPSGARIEFGHCQYDSDRYNYQGPAYQFCLDVETPVLMPDGSWKPIASIEPGDKVMTLEGPAEVTRSQSAGLRECCTVTTPYGSDVMTWDHRIMIEGGTWADPQELTPSRSNAIGSTAEGCTTQYPLERTRLACSSGGLLHTASQPGHSDRETDHAGYVGSREDSRIDFATSGGARLEPPQPQPSSCRAVLFAPGVLSDQHAMRRGVLSRVHQGAHERSSIEDSQSGYREDLCCGGARSLNLSGYDPRSIRRRDGDAERGLLSDDPAPTPSHSEVGTRYVHPYTNEQRWGQASTVCADIGIAPAGARDVWDLTVGGASHFVTSSGIIAANCGFDELTQFTEAIYTYIGFSRVRRRAGVNVPLRTRGASNPGGVGHDWVNQRFRIEKKPGRLFIPSMLEHNPHLDRDEYRASLMELHPYERAQLLDGDWDAKRPGSQFRREWFEVVDAAPPGAKAVRYWDLAATEPKPGRDPDYTAGCLMLKKGGTYYIDDVRRFRAEPGGVRAAVEHQASVDGRAVKVWIEQEPGSSGKFVTSAFVKALAGYSVRGDRVTGNKIVRSDPLASYAHEGNVKIVRGAWNGAFFDEIESPADEGHDDMRDAAAGAFSKLHSSGVSLADLYPDAEAA